MSHFLFEQFAMTGHYFILTSDRNMHLSSIHPYIWNNWSVLFFSWKNFFWFCCQLHTAVFVFHDASNAHDLSLTLNPVFWIPFSRLTSSFWWNKSSSIILRTGSWYIKFSSTATVDSGLETMFPLLLLRYVRKFSFLSLCCKFAYIFSRGTL